MLYLILFFIVATLFYLTTQINDINYHDEFAFEDKNYRKETNKLLSKMYKEEKEKLIRDKYLRTCMDKQGLI